MLAQVKLAVGSLVLVLALLLGLPAGPPVASAQTCWDYTDLEPAKVPLACVLMSNNAQSCGGNPGCYDGDPATACCIDDGDPSDCCTAVPAPGPQTIREMHETWHDCFGAVGASSGVNPPSRSQRWYAFHRQFEIDYNAWRDAIGLGPIQSLPWCPDMNMPYGQGGAGNGNAQIGVCGTGPNRPDDAPCPFCEAFPQCLFFGGAGPAACPLAPGATCGTPGPNGFTLPYTALEDFPNVEEVAAVLDGYFHGSMHFAIAAADRWGQANCGDANNNGILTPAETSACYNLDSLTSNCSPRDPMFWRLHKALDDVVRAWQDSKAVDVVVVIDTSGSMSEPDAAGGSKLQAAMNALDMFADLLEEARPDGQVNRIGIVTYASSAQLRLPLTPVSLTLRAPGGPFDTAVDGILAGGPSGCTGIGAGIERALQELCPPGDCQGFSASGDNDRKAILLLTDGLENVPPCLNPAGSSGGTCGGQCFGSPLAFEKLQYTQVVSVGFGAAGSLNGPLLTLLSERQGGVYRQNPNGPGDDLKRFFVKAMADVSGEVVAVDPEGKLGAADPATPAVTYDSCDDSSLTFSGTWDKAVDPGDLRLVVTSPRGDLVLGSLPAVEASRERLWSHARVRLPYDGASSGSWRAELIRPHRVLVDGFAPTAFVSLAEGTRIAREQIHRLCPQGCKRVLYYEAKVPAGDSAYEAALKVERDRRLVADVDRPRDEREFAAALDRQDWDLIVYARGGDDVPAPADPLLARRLCGGARAIVSDSRPKAGAAILRCSGARHGGPVRWSALDADTWFGGPTAKLRNPGDPQSAWLVVPLGTGQIAARSADTAQPAVVVKAEAGVEQNWGIDVSARGLSKITPVLMRQRWTTGDTILAAARILPSYVRRGGYDRVVARVEVEYPTVSLGTIAARRHGDPRRVEGEVLSGAGGALSQAVVPTARAVFKLNDDGVDGDEVPGNQHYTGELKGLGLVDGHYRLRFIFDLTADGCTTRREATQSLFVEPRVDPDKSRVEVKPGNPAPDGSRTVDVRILPVDGFGNLLGPGRVKAVTCQPVRSCKVADAVRDVGDGHYAIRLDVAAGTGAVRLDGLGAPFHIALPCDGCPRLAGVRVDKTDTREHATLQGTVRLDRPALRAAEGGAVVFLTSSDSRLAQVPASVLVPAGEATATFPVTVRHLVNGKPARLRVEASYGGRTLEALVGVLPHADHATSAPPRPPMPPASGHVHYPLPKP
jgi:hypothetical protein